MPPRPFDDRQAHRRGLVVVARPVPGPVDGAGDGVQSSQIGAGRIGRLGALGPVWVEETGYRDPDLYRRIRLRLETAEARAASLITAHLPALLALARALLAERELAGAGLAALLAALDAQDDPTACARAG